MDNEILVPLIKKYRTNTGEPNLGRLLRDENIVDIKTDLTTPNGKRLTKFVLDGNAFYVKQVRDHDAASAERICSEINQRAGIIAPDTTIATLDNFYYAITNDVFPNKNTEPGEPFLQKITPGGAQYALPKIFGNKEIDPYAMSFFEPEVVEQIAKHYALALATKNWDANIGGLGFALQNGKLHASDLITLDFEASSSSASRFGFANPFSSRRESEANMIQKFKNSTNPYVKKNDLVKTIVDGLDQINDIVYESKEAGFTPSQVYTDKLKCSMHEMAEILEK